MAKVLSALNAIDAFEGWHAHTGNDCPCDPQTWVDVRRADGTIERNLPAIGWNWRQDDHRVSSPIIAWRKTID